MWLLPSDDDNFAMQNQPQFRRKECFRIAKAIVIYMKKTLISVLLSLTILASLSIPVFAVNVERTEDKTVEIVLTEESTDATAKEATDITTEQPVTSEEGATDIEEKTDVTETPSTGEKGKLAPAIILLIVSAAFVVLLIFKRKKAAGNTGEK